MKVERMVLGQIQTNCYFAINEATKETIVIDPADRPDSVLRKAVDEGLTLKAIFLTHGHVFNEKNLPMRKKRFWQIRHRTCPRRFFGKVCLSPRMCG